MLKTISKILDHQNSQLFYPYERKVALWKYIRSDGWSNKHRRLTLNRKIIKLASTTISNILDYQNSVDYFCRNKRIVSYWWLHSKQMTVEQAFWDEDTTNVWIRNTVPRNKSRIKDSPEIKDICSQRYSLNNMVDYFRITKSHQSVYFEIQSKMIV